MKSSIVVLLLLLFAATTSTAQEDSSTVSGGWGKRSDYNRKFDRATVTEIKGEVVKVDTIVPMRAMSPGIHLMVKTATETVSVHLGPKWFLDTQEIKFKAGDKVEVKGSKVFFGGEPAIIAQEVKRGKDTLILRDENGIPEWSGRGKRFQGAD